MKNNTILNFGVKDEMTSFEKSTTILTNKISLFFSGTILFLTLFVVLKLELYNTAAILSGLFLLLVSVPFINKMGGTKFSGFLLSSLVPFFIVAASVIAKMGGTENIDLALYISPRIILIGTLVLPLVLIDYRNSFFFITSLLIHFIAISAYPEIQKFFGVGIEHAVYNPDTYALTIFVSVLAMIILILSSLFFQKINIENIESISKQNELLETQKKELVLIQNETEKLNQKLTERRIDTEMGKIKLQQNNSSLEEFAKQQEKLTNELRIKNIEAEQTKLEIEAYAKAQDKLAQEIFARSLETQQKSFEIETAFKNLKVLGDIGKKIVSVLTVEDIMLTTYKSISELMKVNFFAIGIHNEEKKRLDFMGTIKDNKKLKPYYYELTRKDSFSVWCYKNKKEIFINNLDAEYKNYFEEYPDLQHFDAKSFIYCPLFNKEKIIGTVAVHHKQKDAFLEKNLSIMHNIATYISLAIQNASSYNKIEEQMNEINDKNIMVESSLNYAKTIQNSMLPSVETLKKEFNTELVFFPRDIVSGDFYWTANIFNKRKFLTAIDCTGHGVPGAFLSFVGSKSLDEIVHGKQIFSPKNILSALDENVIKILNQKKSNNRDGMDVSMCAIEETKNGKIKVLFSGAKLPLFYYKKNEKTVKHIKGSRKAIGGGYYDKLDFEEHELLLDKGDILYIATDGYIDQNSKEYKRFGTERFIGMIEEIAKYPISKQKTFIKQIFNKFKNNNLQRDDVTVLITEL